MSIIKNRDGHGQVSMHKGYMVVIFTLDAGQGGGGFAFYDISNPRAPQLVNIKD